jgi:hypothetical protein
MPFPTVIDNTIREAFFTCPTKARYSFIDNLASPTPSVHLHAGGAFAAGLERARRAFYAEGKPEADAEKEGIETLIRVYGDFEAPDYGSGSNKTVFRMMEALASYFAQYPMSQDRIKPFFAPNGEPAVEFTFTFEIPGIAHPETGDPLLYAGRFDMLGVRDDVLFVVDEKTTTSLGAQWTQQWDLNSQFTGYCAAAREYGYPVAGAIIRGIGILKTEIKHQQAVIYRPQWMIDRWFTQLRRDVLRMIEAYENDTWDFALGSACSAYGGCGFKQLCLSNEPERWIEGNFARRDWNPLARGDSDS